MADLMTKSDFTLFIQEFFKRFNENSPKFFRVIGWVSIVMAGIGFIPDILSYLDVALPENWMTVVGKIMIGAGIWGKITAKLAIKVPTAEIMPFTEKKQVQQIQKGLSKEGTLP